VIADDPLFASLVAVIVAEPISSPDTSPVVLTVATVLLELAQVIVRPVNVFPALSLVTAVSCTVPPTCTLADAGLTATVATGTIRTEIADEPLCPSLVAVIVAEPAVTPFTEPLVVTVATDALEVAHVIVRPVSVLPLASLGVAVSCTVWPTARFADAGVTVTVATGTKVTVIADVPLLPSLVAVMVAVPAATPVTRPPLVTVATDGALLPHVTTRPASTFPAESLVVALSWTVWPVFRPADGGATVTVATGTVETVIVALPLLPSLVAVIVAVPTAEPVTTPLPLTVATAPLLLDQVTVLPVSTAPVESRVVAVSCTVCVSSTLADAGLTLTEATGGRVTATVAVSDRLLP